MGTKIKNKTSGFSDKWGFILACIGAAVGMGNIWAFPQRVFKYGGLTFLIQYFIFVLIIGSSGVIGEMGLGRKGKAGPIGAFETAGKTRSEKTGKITRALGFLPVIGALGLAIGYTVVVGWIFKYTFLALTGKLTLQNATDGYIGNLFNTTAVNFGNNVWQIIAVAAVAAILIAGVANGIEKSNRIMMPLFFAMFLFLVVYVAFQPGASMGYKYVFTLNPAGFLQPMNWVFAMGQAFFSLSIAGNGTVIYGSYLKDDVDIPNSAVYVAVFDTFAAMLAAMVIIPAIAVHAFSEGVTSLTPDSVVNGPGLMFVALPSLFQHMAGGIVFAIVFFVAVLFAGVSSLINMFEAPIATIERELKLNRFLSVTIIMGIGLAVSLFIQGIVSGWMDAVSNYLCPFGAGLAGIMFFWVIGDKLAEAELMKGRSKALKKYIIPLGKYVYCPLCAIVLVVGALNGGIG